MMGRSGAALPAELEYAGTVMSMLELIADKDRLAAALKQVADAVATYKKMKTEADQQMIEVDRKAALLEPSRAALAKREDEVKAREDAVKQREDALADRTARLKAAMAP